jgi:hypothetical protein
MRRLTITFAMTILFLCGDSLTWQAKAMISAGASQIRAAVSGAPKAEPAACRGWGEHCPPGYIWNGNRCVPC